MSKINFGDVYRLFFNMGEVVEIRAYGLSRTSKHYSGFASGSGIVSGYFDNPKDFAIAATHLEQLKAGGIYFTLNPCTPELLARCANRLQASGAKTPLTTDKDILYIRWLPIDIDSAGTSGISANQAEIDEACKVRDAIAVELLEKMQVAGIRAMSGNGAHLLLRLRDKKPDDLYKQRIKNALTLLNDKYATDLVKIDLMVFNPARIIKLYGTTARKGDDVPDRPHRVSYIEPDVWVKAKVSAKKKSEVKKPDVKQKGSKKSTGSK